MATKSVIGRFGTVLLCDDVRREINNKRSIMGNFSGDVLVSAFPAEIPLSFYIEYLPTGEDVDIGLEIQLGTKKSIRFNTKIEKVPRGQVAVFDGFKIMLKVENKTELKLYAVINKKRRLLLRKKIAVGQLTI